jgi:hypothetical protein
MGLIMVNVVDIIEFTAQLSNHSVIFILITHLL